MRPSAPVPQICLRSGFSLPGLNRCMLLNMAIHTKVCTVARLELRCAGAIHFLLLPLCYATTCCVEVRDEHNYCDALTRISNLHKPVLLVNRLDTPFVREVLEEMHGTPLC